MAAKCEFLPLSRSTPQTVWFNFNQFDVIGRKATEISKSHLSPHINRISRSIGQIFVKTGGGLRVAHSFEVKPYFQESKVGAKKLET